MKRVILSIDGMTCSACSGGLERFLSKQKGISAVSVNLVLANASVEYDENIIDLPHVEEYVKKAGFQSLGIYHDVDSGKKRKGSGLLLAAGAVAVLIMMYISMGHMISLPVPEILDPMHAPGTYAAVLCAFAVLFLAYGWDILAGGFKNLIHGMPNMDTLVGLGTLSSFAFSVYGMIRIFRGDAGYVSNLYFESSAMVIFFVKLGRYIDGISRGRTRDAIGRLVKITPETAVIKTDGGEKKVRLDEVRQDDILICRPGEKIAADGTVLSGSAHTDESFITGESRPAAKTVGDRVIAGSVNYNGYIEYRAEKVGKESAVSEIVKLITEASSSKAPIARLADRISGYFVPAVMILAALVFGVYILLGRGFADSLKVFVTILVVACPCSLGLATPLAVMVGEGLCAERGILIKKSAIFETAPLADAVVFDKTGTLTYGRPRISDKVVFESAAEREAMAAACSLERLSAHPISGAFTKYAESEALADVGIGCFEEISGNGVKGDANGAQILVGNAGMLAMHGVDLPDASLTAQITENGGSPVYIAYRGKAVLAVGISDVIREDAKEAIDKLNGKGILTYMLTGDSRAVAERTAARLGIERLRPEVLPAQKENCIKELKADHRCVLMCGDGINDSPALTSADIGISIESGTDIAMDSADVILTSNKLSGVVSLIEISRKTLRVIKQNLFWAFFYNSLMLPIAAGALSSLGIVISPMTASIAMVLSSLTVTFNALRLKAAKFD